MSIAIKIPPLPFALTEAKVGHWYRNSGEVVARGELLVELEVRGEVIPILIPQAGIIEKTFFKTGEMAAVSAIIATLKTGLPNLVWDQEQQVMILDSYKAGDVTTSMEYELRQMIRLGEGKIAKGFGSGLALPQIQSSSEPGLGAGHEMGAGQDQYYKANPKLKDSSQFSGDFKNPNVTRVPENAGAQMAPQNAPTLGATPTPTPSAPTLKRGG